MFTYKKKYIFFSKLEKRHFLFLFFFIISCIKHGIQIYFENNQGIGIEFLYLYIYNLGDFVTIIPYIILKKNVKK